MPEMPMSAVLAWHAERKPDAPALTCNDVTLTWAELDARTNRLARAYEAMGVGENDFVTIALANSSEFLEATMATLKLGATPQPVSNKLPTMELDAIIELAAPALVVGMAAKEKPHLLAGFEPDPDLSDAPLPLKTAKSWKAPTSGGSTGRPKIIVAGQAATVDPEMGGVGIRPDGVVLVPGPLYHNAPFMAGLSGLQSGNHVIIMPRFDALQCLELIEKYGVTNTVMVPTMMHRISRLGEDVTGKFDMSSLEMVLHLAAPCPAWLKEEWINWLGGDVINELYAGTEGQAVTWITGSQWLEHRGSVGPVLMGQMKVFDEDGNEAPVGEVGEIYMLPPGGRGSTYKYIGADSKARDDWESLGDMGYFDEDNFLYLADRQTDMILTGGANIYPAEVEAALEAHDQVKSSAVIGLPDEDLGQKVHAIIEPDGDIDEDLLLAHLAERLVRYKIPRSFEYVDEPLRSDAGKVRRSQLRSERVAAQ